MKKIVALVLALLLCAPALSVLAEDASVQAILDKGQLVLGLDDSFPPMGFRDEANEIVGFDIDVAQEVAARLGVELVKQPIDWPPRAGAGRREYRLHLERHVHHPGPAESMAMTFAYLNNAIEVYVKTDSASPLWRIWPARRWRCKAPPLRRKCWTARSSRSEGLLGRGAGL